MTHAFVEGSAYLHRPGAVPVANRAGLRQHDHLLRRTVSLDRGRAWLDWPGGEAKQAGVRDALRRLPDGEFQWQLLQAEVYGPRIADAAPYSGLAEFLRTGVARGVRFFVVSHKGRYAAQDAEQRHDLVSAAREWLASHQIVSATGPVLPEDAYFEPSRHGKVARIGQLACDAFVNDLEETFAEPGFPSSSRAFLIDHGGRAVPGPNVAVCRSWDDVSAELFADDN